MNEFYKSESFVTCPDDVFKAIQEYKKAVLIDDIIDDASYIITKSGIENDYLICKYDNILGTFLESDIYSYDILYAVLLQFLTDSDYTIFLRSDKQ